MSKKKAVMALTTLEQFTIGGNLDVSDVLSVVTSRAEQKYSAEIDRCRQEIAEADAEIDRLSKQAASMTRREASELVSESVAALKVALKPFKGSKVTVHPCDHLSRDEKLVQVTVKVACEKSTYYSTEFLTEAKPSKELVEAFAAVEAAKAEKSRLQSEAVSWRQKKSNVPMLERQYRARIAETKLSSSEDGLALLDLLTRDLDASILSLPAC